MEISERHEGRRLNISSQSNHIPLTDYFNVYPLSRFSTETGVGTVNSIRYNKFSTTYTGGVGPENVTTTRCLTISCGCSGQSMLAISEQALIIMVPNSTDYGGICRRMWESGAAIAFCPKSDYGYQWIHEV